MPVCGLVITLDEPAISDWDDRLAVEMQGRLTCGDLRGSRLPAVLDTATEKEASRLLELLADTPGVMSVDVVSVVFEDAERPGVGS
jgi:hypothetical protein